MSDNNYPSTTPKFCGESNLRARQQIMAGGFLPVPDRLLHHVSSGELLVFGYLLSCVQEGGGGRCYPAQHTIARRTHMSQKTVKTALRSLRIRNLLSWETTRNTNSYFIHPPNLTTKLPHKSSKTNLANKKRQLSKGFLPVPNHILLVDGLTRNDVIVFSTLMRYTYASKAKTGRCYPTQSTLSQRIGFHPRVIRRSLLRLRNLGLVSWERSPDFGCANEYFIHLSETAVQQIRAKKPDASIEVTGKGTDEEDELSNWQQFSC